MIIKQCQFAGRDTNGEYIQLLRAGYDNGGLIKEAAAVAAPPQLGVVQRFMKRLPRTNGKLYTLISALGAGEYWGSNSNADEFPEEPLLHVPPGWNDLPHEQQIIVGRKWQWGYPTFYNAHAFAHHQNKDPNRAFGNIEYVMWDSHMKRVLLIVSFDHARAAKFGSTGVIDRVENGEFPSVSMGCRVPYDVCSYCADWSRITLNPSADIAEHRRRPITGLSTETGDYCHHLKNELNKIYPDGKKVMMKNMHPRFFDLSVVFIGADKTSFVLAKLAGECPIQPGTRACGNCHHTDCVPSAHVAEVWGRGVEKMASAGGVVTGVLGGGAAGAALGELVGEKKDRLRNMGIGAATGALGGGALGLSLGRAAAKAESRNIKEIARSLPRPSVQAKPKSKAQIDQAKKSILAKLDPEGVVEKTRQQQADLKKAEQAWEKTKNASDLGDLEWEDPKTEQRIGEYLKRKRMSVGRIKTSSLDKRSEIIKQIQSSFRRSLPTLQREEPDMPRDLQDRLSERMSDGLSTAGGLGIVAKPREFQRMYIRAIGRPGLADELDDKKLMFRTGAAPSDDFRLSSSIVPKILSALLPMMGSRSAMTPSIGKRTIIMIKCGPKSDIEEEHGCAKLDHPLMSKVSSAYSAYRRDLLYKSAGLIKQAVFTHPEIHHALRGDSVLEEGLVKEGADVLESVIGMLTSTYLNEAYLGEPVSEFVESNCNLAGLERASGLAVLGGVA